MIFNTTKEAYIAEKEWHLQPHFHPGALDNLDLKSSWEELSKNPWLK